MFYPRGWLVVFEIWVLRASVFVFVENEALENEGRSTKHPNLENEAPKTRNHCRLKNYNFKSCMTLASEQALHLGGYREK